jgi:hypothetical protein
MKKSLLLLALVILLPLTVIRAEDVACGDDGVTCGTDEHCCEHVIAMFSGDHASAPAYVQGQCIPKAQKCAEFWCGNRQCSSGFFGSPSVCCINMPVESSTPQYSCAYSELNCPGNTQQLTIRDNQPNRTLRRG